MDISSTAPSMYYTIGAYVALAGIALAVYLRQSGNRRVQPTRPAGRQTDTSAAIEAKKKTEKTTKPKPKPKTPASKPAEDPSSSVNYNWEEDEAAGKKADREFARQLATTHAGTTFNTKKSDDKRAKSVKQSKAQEIGNASPDKTSVPSSNAGDADDDLSPQASPIAEAADGRDVSDMLEATAPGPSVLRLTDTDSAKKPKERKAKVAEPVETKKQRQNRKKAEAAKAAREEEEKDRKMKLEQQRRTARIAEGRAAKDGSAFTSNTQNAWKDKSTSGSEPFQLLDTAEQTTKSEPVKSSTPTPAVTTKTPSSDHWSSMPSEEEQMEMLRQEDSWNEVKTKKKGKKKGSSAETSSTPTPAVNGTSNAAPTANAKPQAAINGTKKPLLTSSSSSFAALTPDTTTDDNDEAEQEWDV